VTFVDSDNSTCAKKTTPNELDQSNEVNLKMSYDGEYLWTTKALRTYYKPKDAFVCCYLSKTYGKLYSDGYGLNFYTHEYGYYEYCDNLQDQSVIGEIKKGGAAGAVAGISASVFVLGALYCFCKRNDGKDGGEESDDENAPTKIIYNINTNVINTSTTTMNTNMYSMGGGIMPGVQPGGYG
jgi:hypothetical protein